MLGYTNGAEMSKQLDLSKGFAGSLIVGGTAIGAGMLGLPIATAMGGFFPAVLIYVVCWLFCMSTGLLFLEICTWMPPGSNIVSMAKQYLGRSGEVAAWLLYIFLFYTLTIAYVSVGGGFAHALFEGALPLSMSTILFTLIFASFVYVGAKAVDKLNMVLMIGLVCSFLAFMIVGLGHVKTERLLHVDFEQALLGLPVILTAFSYHGTIPTLYEYLERNTKQMRFAIIFGTSLPFLTYILWEYLILGIIPLEGKYSLAQALKTGQTAVAPLGNLLPGSPIFMIGQFFSAFALTTSFIGVTLGLLDFLADGFKVEKTHINRFWLSLAIFIPPIVISLTNPGIFLTALGYAGSIGCALLLGLMPALMVWVGRYMRKETGERQLVGGRSVLLLLYLFVALELLVEFYKEVFV